MPCRNALNTHTASGSPPAVVVPAGEDATPPRRRNPSRHQGLAGVSSRAPGNHRSLGDPPPHQHQCHLGCRLSAFVALCAGVAARADGRTLVGADDAKRKTAFAFTSRLPTREKQWDLQRFIHSAPVGSIFCFLPACSSSQIASSRVGSDRLDSREDTSLHPTLASQIYTGTVQSTTRPRNAMLPSRVFEKSEPVLTETR